MKVLIVGCGYVGIPLGKRLIQRGHQVWGMRRGDEGREEVEKAGIGFLQGDVTDPESLRRIAPEFDWVVNLVSSSKGGEDEYRAVYYQGNRNLVEWLKGSTVKSFVYTSSTSVYAQTDGSVVTEQSEATGSSGTSRILLEAERVLMDAARAGAFPASILRVAGIYGPGRGHMYQQFLIDQARMVGTGERLLNMIHLEDLVDVIIAALQQPKPGEIYNVADEYSPTEKEFYQWLSVRLFKPMPPPADPEKAKIRKRGLTSKRVANEKLKGAFGFWFLYPTFKEGYEKLILNDFPSGPLHSLERKTV